MAQPNTAMIRGAVGVRSVYLAAKLDEKLVGKFFHMEGQFLLDRDGRHVTKRALADVMCYMAGQYKKTLTLADVELGLLVAAKEYGQDDGHNIENVTEPKSEVEPKAFLDEEPDEDAVVSMEIANEEDDIFTEDFISDEPIKPRRRGRPGVKPDDAMIAAILSGENKLQPDDIGISTFDLAIRYYDWIGNDLAVAESGDQLNHKVKLAIGSTMKALGWKKRMRKGEWGWHPTEEFTFGISEAPLIDPDDVVLRKRDQLVEDPEEPEEPVNVVDELPRLSEKTDKVMEADDIPWPDFTEEFDDGSELQPKTEQAFVKVVDVENGIEDVVEMEIFVDKTMTFVMHDGQKRMLEWDGNEDIWTYHVEKEAI